MPFSSTIDVEHHLIITTGVGVITASEALACCTQLRERAEFNGCRDKENCIRASFFRFFTARDSHRQTRNLRPGADV